MIAGILTAALAVGALWTSIGVVLGRVASGKIDIFIFNAILYSLSAVACAPLVSWGAVFSGEAQRLGELVLWIGLSGAIDMAGLMILIKAMESGSQAVPWTLAQMAMCMPFIWGVVWGGDRPSWISWAGVGLMLCCVATLGFGQLRGEKSKAGSATLLLSVAAFLTLGLAQTLSAVPNYWNDWSDAGNLRSFISVVTPALLLLGYCAIRKAKIEFQAVKLGVVGAALTLAGFICLYKSMDLLAEDKLSALCYPLAVGSCVIGVLLHSRLALKERFDTFKTAGAAVGVTGVLLAGAGCVLERLLH